MNNPLTADSPLSSWLDYLQKLHPKTIDLSLDRLLPIATKHQLTKPAPYVITVAGTNGKGSTCAMIAETLIASGYQVGVYSSPHIIDFEERVRINSKIVTAHDFCQAFAQIEQWREEPLTFFESVTLAAMLIFQQAKLDVVVLEVGLGGRFDATNIVAHDIAIVTSVALDHLAFLGDNVETIGYEKAGIFKTGVPALCGQAIPPATVLNYANEIGAPFYCQGDAFGYSVDDNQWQWWDQDQTLRSLPIPNIHLDNASTALMALMLSGLKVPLSAIKETLAHIQVPGRFQKLATQPDLYIDVAHNPHAAIYLAVQLRRLKTEKRAIHAVVGMMADKDIKSSLKALIGVVDYWYPAGFTDLPRGASAETIKQCLLEIDPTIVCASFATIDASYHAAIVQANSDDVIIAFGSFHVVEQMIHLFKSLEKL